MSAPKSKGRQLMGVGKVLSTMRGTPWACAALAKSSRSVTTSEGLETVALRMERHCANAQTIAERLLEHPAIAWVNYPGLESSPYYALAKKYMPHGSCGVVSFGIKGGRAAATKFMDSLQLASVVTHVADLRTCVLHPASTTHRQLSDAQLVEAGVSPDLIRLSVGIENPEDIWADILQALEKANG